MASLVTHPDTASQRVRLVADAVVSAYINEISAPAPPRPAQSEDDRHLGGFHPAHEPRNLAA